MEQRIIKMIRDNIPLTWGSSREPIECDSDHQRSYYICGVGTTGEFIEKHVGRAGGYGLSANIIEGYRYLCKNFLKCEGDRIYLFGFSRGAFTARSLAGFANSVGILLANSVDDKIEQAFALYQLGIAGGINLNSDNSFRRRYAKRAQRATMNYQSILSAYGTL